MKKFITLFIFLSLHLLSHAQGGTWTLMKGNAAGHTGTIGVPNAADYPDGRYQATQWTDTSGNFWIFGGEAANNGFHNDLWMYNPTTNIWTWMNGDPLSIYRDGVYGTMGIPGPNNVPSARGYGSQAWTDKQNRLWLHGGCKWSGQTLDDMWMYDISTNQWTWMKGGDTIEPLPVYGTLQVADTGNTPGGRAECNTAWVKSDGSFWMFGGQGDFGAYNDLWKFDINTNNWAWMSGPQGPNSPFSYGIKNIEAGSNVPPPRDSYTHWIDEYDNLYIFAGANFDSVTVTYDDLWECNNSNNLWTWISGSSAANDFGYNTLECSPDCNTYPSGRFENRSVQSFGYPNLLWLSDGYIYDSIYGGTSVKDLWNFNLQTMQWTLVSNLNSPPGTAGHCLWADKSGSLWMWGGTGSWAVNPGGYMWRFVPDTTCLAISNAMSAPVITQTGNILTSSPAAVYQWQRNGVNISGDTLDHITVIENGTYTVIVKSVSGCSNSASVTITNVGINSLDDHNEISIYPNPATQSCSIYISNYDGESYTARLTDMTGKEVSSLMSFSASTFTFPVSQYASGVYILHISDSRNGQFIKKLVVE